MRIVEPLRWRLGPSLKAAALLRHELAPASLPAFAWRFGAVERRVPCAHTISELAEVAAAVLARKGLAGEVAEFGSFKGGSTARLSLACAETRKRLLVFDSFDGLPEPGPGDRLHRIRRAREFRRGEYRGALDEVQANVRRAGRLDVCEFVPGWFEDSLAAHPLPALSVALVDVDLVASTRRGLEAVWPAIVPGGVVFVHDTADEKLTAFLRDWVSRLEPSPRRMRFPDQFAALFEK